MQPLSRTESHLLAQEKQAICRTRSTVPTLNLYAAAQHPPPPPPQPVVNDIFQNVFGSDFVPKFEVFNMTFLFTQRTPEKKPFWPPSMMIPPPPTSDFGFDGQKQTQQVI